jgi:hypothetical protein
MPILEGKEAVKFLEKMKRRRLSKKDLSLIKEMKKLPIENNYSQEFMAIQKELASEKKDFSECYERLCFATKKSEKQEEALPKKLAEFLNYGIVERLKRQGLTIEDFDGLKTDKIDLEIATEFLKQKKGKQASL